MAAGAARSRNTPDRRLAARGSARPFNELLVKIQAPDEVKTAHGKVTRSTFVLDTAQGYHNLNGREVTVTQKKRTIMLLRVEDCGLGSAKADAFIEALGCKRAWHHKTTPSTAVNMNDKYRVITTQGALTVEAGNWADALIRANQICEISGAVLNAIGRIGGDGKLVKPGWHVEE
jgi:hypothetical protein